RVRLAQVRDLLAMWIERRHALAAAEQTKRLMDDLALAVAGVEHIAVHQATLEVPGLALGLVLDHPLAGAQFVELQVTASGASVRVSRPASPAEARGLQAGGLPTLNAAGDAPLRAQLAETARALGALGERPPKVATEAQERLAKFDER